MPTAISLLKKLTADGDFSRDDLLKTAQNVVELGGLKKNDLTDTKKLFTNLITSGAVDTSLVTLEQFQQLMGGVTRRYSSSTGTYGSSLSRTGVLDIMRLQAAYVDDKARFTQSHEADLSDPRLPPHGLIGGDSPKYPKQRFRGDIPMRPPVVTDIEQGWLDNCAFTGAAAAVIHTHGEWFYKNCFKRHADDTFSYRINPDPFGKNQREWQPVDRDLYVFKSGRPLFGRGGNSLKRPTMNPFYPLLEKAAVQTISGGYSALDNGGHADQYLSMLMPGKADWNYLRELTQTKLLSHLNEAQQKSWPTCLTTFDSAHAKQKAAGKDGIIANHTYAFMGLQEEPDGTYVQVYNPWHSGEIKDNPKLNGKNDGVFFVKLEKLKDYFEGVFWLVPDKKKMNT